MKPFNKNKALRKIKIKHNKNTYIKRLSISLSCLILLIGIIMFTFARFETSSDEYTLINGKVIDCTFCEQKINYKFLYDGSLGNTSSNQMSTNTGGWVRYSYTGGVYTPGNNSIYATGVGNSKDTNGFGTNNLISFTEYNKLYMSIMVDNTYYYSETNTNYTWWSPKIMSAKTFTYDTPNTLVHLVDADGQLLYGWGYKNVKRLYSADVTSINNGYPAVAYANWGHTGTYGIYLYSAFLTKEDNWQELANIAGISASSIDDILTNSHTLLSKRKAVNYMIYNCTGDFMVAALSNSTFKNELESSRYKQQIYDNFHWNKFITIL